MNKIDDSSTIPLQVLELVFSRGEVLRADKAKIVEMQAQVAGWVRTGRLSAKKLDRLTK